MEEEKEGRKKVGMEYFNIYVKSGPKTNLRLPSTISICYRNLNEKIFKTCKGNSKSLCFFLLYCIYTSILNSLCAYIQ